MMQDNLKTQNYLQEEESIDIKKEARLLPVFLALVYRRYTSGCCRVLPVSKNCR